MTKSLLVTGASSELGISILDAIAPDFGIIFAHYRKNKEALDSIVSKYSQIIPVQAEFSPKGNVEPLVSKIREEGIALTHIIHLSSPRPTVDRISKLNLEDFELNMAVQCYSILNILKIFVPEMARARYGNIIFVLTSSLLGLPPKGLSAYVAAKYYLLGLMKSFVSEYSHLGVNFNAVSPSMIETGFLENFPDLTIEISAKQSPMKRNLTPEDIVPAIQYLLKDATRSINGANVPITGGAPIP